MSADTNERTLLAPLFLQHAGASPAVAASLSILAGYNLCTDAPLALSADPHSATDALLCVIARLQARGLHARYTIAPADSLSHLATCGPLVLATDSPLDTPAGLLVVWRRFGPLFQALDTQAGRRWFAVRQLKQFADETVTSIACAEWRRYAVADAWILRSRLVQLTQDEDAAERITQAALAAPGWRPLAALDAALRLGDTLAAAGAIERGNEARTQIERLISQTLASPDGVSGPIPTAFWAVQAESEDTLLCRGVPVVLCVGLAEGVPAARQPRPRPSRPGRLADYWCDQPGRLGLLVAGAGVAAAGVVTQVMLLRGLLALGQLLPTLGQRTVTVGLLLAFVLSLLLLEVSLATLLGRQGRRLDARLRMAFMTLLPRLGSQTFQHLSTADLMERIHTARDLHNLPDLSGQIARTFFQIIFTLLGLALISPLCAAVGLVNVILVLGLVLAGAELAGAQNRMLRAALSDLSRLALDSMLGSVAIHAHLAGSALTSEHEQRLVRWAHQALALAKTEIWTSALAAIISALLVALSIMLYGLVGTAVHLPLLLFWSLQLGTLSEQLARLGFSYVGEVSKGERYLALTKLPCEAAHAADAPAPTPPTGVAVMLDGVAVEQDGLPILKEIRLTIAPGSHVAIVGPSGAGKSTLVGLLLGRSRPACGSLSVDGVPLTESALATLRAQTAWVDPAVQIWNRSFLSNITYGSGLAAPRTAVDLIAAGLIEQLPHGMQSNLGERGRLVSGGQGQRVRYGRAVQHQGARLVILDEPFRGLDREQRRTLLAHARACWTGATLLYVTHDIAHTTDFDRVLVLADGQLVEDGAPADLMGRAGSCYTTLLADDQAVDTRIWAGRDIPWRRVMLSEGQLEATAPAPSLCPDSPAPSPTVPAPTIQAGSELLWEEARLPELLAWLVRHAFGKQDLLDRADSHHNAASLPIDQQIASLTGRYGLEVEPFALRADALAMSLDHAGPALLRLADGRWIALSVGGRRWLHVIAANGTWRRISFARLQSIMHAAHKPPNREAVAHMLLPLALDERQEEIAARALFEGDRRTAKLAEGWSLRLGAEAPLWAQLRRAKIPQALLLAAVAEALLSLLFVLGIGGAGLLAAHGLVIWPWMGALALCVISSIPIDLWKRHYQLAVSMRLRTLLKRRLHAGVIRLMPGDIQQYGIGQFLSWLMEAERLESVASAGPLLLTTSVALLICVALLSGGVVGGLLAPLLLSWLGATALLSWRAYHAYRAQRSCHIETSRDTLERLDGHLTRLAQENPAHWHNEEDAALAGYLALSQRDDHYRSALATLVPYGWLLLALAALAPTLIANTGDTLRLGISLFGISWAFQLLRSLAPTIIDLLRVVGAWQLLSPIEQAARRCAADTEPSVEVAVSPAANRPLLEIRNLSFGYLGQRRPLINHGDLAVYYGERLLLTGPSGGGKSTLAALLSRLRPPHAGLLLLNGLDQYTLSPANWRRQVVMVAQFHENHLFSASLAFNLLMGRQWPPREEDLREAERLCCELGLDDLLHRMPAGLGQRVGEGGWQLSHGERSRLFIARALLQQAQVIILDESLAAVDAVNMRATMRCVLAHAPTLIVIAHP